MGIGMCVIVPPDAVDAALGVLDDGRVVGRVVGDRPGVHRGPL